MRCISVLVATLCAVLTSAIEADEGIEFFEKRVRPLLVEHCHECHSAGAKKLAGGLLLDSRAGWLKGGETGAAIEPGKPEASLLIRAVRFGDDALQMPPQGKLPDTAIADLVKWVEMGAPDPRIDAAPSSPITGDWPNILRQRRDWWSLKPVAPTAAPDVKKIDWVQSPLDRFVLARLEEAGLSPGAMAAPAVLARRLSLTLTGLPPTPAQLARFSLAAERDRQAALARLVDELLASPHFGERWARHWMDVVRFTETHGNEWNYEVHHAWRYRDYLIRAFNADLPYDQFVREHIAGDLLPPRWNDQEGLNEAVIATAFYRFGEVNHDDCIALPDIGYDLEDNQLDTLTKAFQATTVACARCHDHKLDAISMRDYYALLGVLRSSRLVSHTIDAPETNAAALRQLAALKSEIRREIASVWQGDAKQIAQYLHAARARRANQPYADQLAIGLDSNRLTKWIEALAVEKAPLEDLFEPVRRLATVGGDAAALSAAWASLVDEYARENRTRSEFNQSQFTTFADFRGGALTDWQTSGLGLRQFATRSGDFALQPSGDAVVKSILPAGVYTHALSEKLNGALRSSILPPGKAKISFQVIGQRSSAVRLVSNNCQLNYVNYRALVSDGWQWVTFSPPDNRQSLRTYAELMTMFDNPKFPDQLSALGGDKANYKLPWEKAAEDPRSYFGITRVVLHDTAEAPRPEVEHLLPFVSGDAPGSFNEVAERFVAQFDKALESWAADRAGDDEVAWLDAFLRRELLTNVPTTSPRLHQLVAEYRRIEAGLALPHVVPGICDAGPGVAQPLLARGDCRRPGEPVERRYLEALSTSPEPFAAAGSGRLELAGRIATSDNPLTARVMVNRIWHHLFGTGLVPTVDDFGHLGELPSHAALLDYLAARFMEDGWSVKRLIRSIVLSRTFQSASQPSPEARQLDPANRLLAHYPVRRLDAEAIRDGILAVSGSMAPTMFGMSVQPYRNGDNADRRLFAGPLNGHGRRSVYIKNNLMEAPQFLGVFNVPGGKVAQGRRDVTNVPAQALALLNDPFVLAQAGAWGERLVRQPHASIDERVADMFQTALARSPTEDELRRFTAAVAEFGRLHDACESEIMKCQGAWADAAHVMFNLAEFVYLP